MNSLEERMKADLRLRNLRPATQEQYVRHLRSFTSFHGRDAGELGAEEVREFLLVEESGTDIRVIQVVLGHRSIRTTQRYAQVSATHVARTKSPLELLGTRRGKELLG